MEEIKGRTAKLISENDPQETWQEIVDDIYLEETETPKEDKKEQDFETDRWGMPVVKPDIDLSEPDYVDTERPMIGRGWLIIGLMVFFIIANN